MTLTPRRLRWLLTLYPPYLFAGIRVTRISPDWRELDVSLPLRWYNRNFVGTHFGGNLYSMADPHIMLLLMRLLGRDYIVWDQAASIRFEKPGRGRVHLSVRIDDEVLEAIREKTRAGAAYRPEFTLTVSDEAGARIATVIKTLYVRRK